MLRYSVSHIAYRDAEPEDADIVPSSMILEVPEDVLRYAEHPDDLSDHIRKMLEERTGRRVHSFFASLINDPEHEWLSTPSVGK